MTLYCLCDSQNVILSSSLAENLEEAKTGFQDFYSKLDVHDINKDIILNYQNGLYISSICNIDFEKGKIKKLFRKECLLYG